MQSINNLAIVWYLGHVISDQGVKPNPEKISIIKNFPIPQNAKDIKSFLGLAGYYRRFIENFSNLTKPLTKLLKKNTSFSWTFEQQNSFDMLREKLTSEPILQYPDFNREFVLTTDASNFAIGAILSQGKIGEDLPIAYASRTLNKSECNYSTTERELLAIVWATKHFRSYLYGRKFKIVTDHRPLTWLFSVKDPGSKLIRWRLKLEEFDYEIIYKPGKVNSNADCLSRTTTPIINSIQVKSETFNDFYKFQQMSEICEKINVNKVTKSIIDEKGHIAYFVSTDLEDCEIDFIEDIDYIRNTQHELYSVVKINSLSRFIFLSFVKLRHYDTIKYSDLFYVIQNLKLKLKNEDVTEITLPNPCDSFSNLKLEKIISIVNYIFRKENIKVNICTNKLIEPTESEIKIILKEFHDSPIGGHQGFYKMYNRIKTKYKWENMSKQIRSYIKNCIKCQINKKCRKSLKVPMEITTTSSQPFERLAIDVVGPLPLSENGNKFILTMQDDLTKFSFAHPIPNHEAKTVADKLVDTITNFGIPKTILTDQGTDFTSNLLKEVTKLFQIKHLMSSAYHPQTNGALERSHSTLKDYLKHYINDNQTDWDEYLKFAMFSYNTAIHSSTKFTPYELLFGHKPILPNSLKHEPEFKYTYDNYMDQLKYRLNKSHHIAKENLIINKEKSKSNYDSNSKDRQFAVNDNVFLKNEITKIGKNKKLSSDWKGPYKIISISKPNAIIQIKRKKVKVHFNRLKLANIVSDADASTSR